jgi:hypothetical protein
MKYDRPKYTSQLTSCRASQPWLILESESIWDSQLELDLARASFSSSYDMLKFEWFTSESRAASYLSSPIPKQKDFCFLKIKKIRRVCNLSLLTLYLTQIICKEQ